MFKSFHKLPLMFCKTLKPWPGTDNPDRWIQRGSIQSSSHIHWPHKPSAAPPDELVCPRESKSQSGQLRDLHGQDHLRCLKHYHPHSFVVLLLEVAAEICSVFSHSSCREEQHPGLFWCQSHQGWRAQWFSPSDVQRTFSSSYSHNRPHHRLPSALCNTYSSILHDWSGWL